MQSHSDIRIVRHQCSPTPLVHATYLLGRLDGEELVLALGATHVAERSVVRHVAGDKRDLVHSVFVFYYLGST